MTAEAEAFAILKEASTFSFAEDAYLHEISKLMTKEEVEDGHVFLNEGEECTKWFILDEGTVCRYKGSGDDKQLLDKLEGRGRVTALFHSLNVDHKCYSTVVASGNVKLWSVDAKAYRDLLAANGPFALQLAAHLARLLRHESKVSKALANARGSLTNNEDGSSPSKVLRVLCYDSTEWVRTGFGPALIEFNKKNLNNLQIVMEYTEDRLNSRSAAYANGYDAVCTFVNDTASEDVIRMLSMLGVKMIAQRAAGFDRIDTKAALTFGLTVARVPAYSPYAVAEHAISLLMSLNRKITRASSRVHMANFTLDSGLMGMDIHGKTVGGACIFSIAACEKLFMMFLTNLLHCKYSHGNGQNWCHSMQHCSWIWSQASLL